MMLYLMRHGEASGGSLTQKGAAEVRRVTETLAARGASPTRIEYSPTRRTMQTAQIVARAFPTATIVESLLLGPDANAVDVVSTLSAEHGDLLLVSHQPVLAGVAATLLRGTEAVDFVPAAVAAFYCSNGDWELSWRIGP